MRKYYIIQDMVSRRYISSVHNGLDFSTDIKEASTWTSKDSAENTLTDIDRVAPSVYMILPVFRNLFKVTQDNPCTTTRLSEALDKIYVVLGNDKNITAIQFEDDSGKRFNYQVNGGSWQFIDLSDRF